MLSALQRQQLANCARMMIDAATTSGHSLAVSLAVLSEKATPITVGELEALFYWLHPTARLRVLEALRQSDILQLDAPQFRVNREGAGVLSVVLDVLGTERENTARRGPEVYLTPPDLLTAVSEDVGELRQLLIELVARARSQVRLVTPFFSEIAIQDVLAPLDTHVATPLVDVYLSLENKDRQRARRLQGTLQRRFPGVAFQLFLNIRPDGETLLPHAKLVLCDGNSGYLGTANISQHGLRGQFEAGVRLEAHAVRALEQALDELTRRGVYLKDIEPKRLVRVIAR